ncbi:Uncharacterized MFS-type transporter [hydrothermal vent metagenome]|uniref:Uncharacterized MFS-type transporter n=1 Tax=hydrothermal vent metagenome TaxID=652676 RepID=A0A3B1DVS9_9ZZZZ
MKPTTEPTIEPATPPSKKALGIIFMTVFIDLLGFGIVLPLLPQYGDFYKSNKWELGALMSAFSAMQFLFAPIWGRLSDKIGRRPILMLGLAGSSTSYLLFGYVSSLAKGELLLGMNGMTWLFITRITAGIAGATISTAAAYIADVTGRAGRAKGMALIGAAFGIGFTFGPLIGAFFVSDDMKAPPSSAPGYVAGILSAMALLSAIFVLPESLRPNNIPKKRHWIDLESFGKAIRNPVTLFILSASFLAIFSFSQFETTIPLLARYKEISPKQIFYLLSFIGLVMTISQGGIVRRLIPRLGEFKMGLAGTLLLSAGLMLLAVFWNVDSITALLAIVSVCVVGFSFISPSLQSMLSLQADETEQGGILGLGQSVSAIARIAGPFVGVVLFKLHDEELKSENYEIAKAKIEQSISYPYWSGAALMLLAALFLLTLRNADSKAITRED